MGLASPDAPLATAADLREDDRCEVIAGAVVEKAAPSFEHADAQSGLAAELKGPFQRGRGGGPGGWWIATEVEVEFETHEVYLPDLAGWRRDRVPQRPAGRPVRIRPDWVCEILSPSTRGRDTTAKLRTYQRCAVPHYWVVDLARETLTVHRWTPDGYLVALTASADEVVRAEPFDAIELRVGLLFGREEPDEPPAQES